MENEKIILMKYVVGIVSILREIVIHCNIFMLTSQVEIF